MNFDAASMLCYPMHGQKKLSEEGYRTRDGHLIQWFGRLRQDAPVAVISRPEPIYLDRAKRKGSVATNTLDVSSKTWRVPNVRDRRRWWVDSIASYPKLPTKTRQAPAVVWNPFVALADASRNPFKGTGTTVVDLLDDWTVHYAFESIASEVDEAYRAAFKAADFVTANSPGTLSLAHRYGRTDAHLLLNGVDADRFEKRSTPNGALSVGYVGKIGKRVDLESVVATVSANPTIEFTFAGPILDSEYTGPLSALSNLRLLGDVHYDDVPELLQSFDIGWIPHRVGDGEVGGDVIKTYEYRAAGLQVLASPFAGVNDKGFSALTVIPGSEHAQWLQHLASSTHRVKRVEEDLPEEMSWKTKAEFIMGLYA